MFGVVPGEVLGPPRVQDEVEDLLGLVRSLVLVVEVVDANLVVGGPHVRQLKFVQLLALVYRCDFDLEGLQLFVWKNYVNEIRFSRLRVAEGKEYGQICGEQRPMWHCD